MVILVKDGDPIACCASTGDGEFAVCRSYIGVQTYQYLAESSAAAALERYNHERCGPATINKLFSSWRSSFTNLPQA